MVLFMSKVTVCPGYSVWVLQMNPLFLMLTLFPQTSLNPHFPYRETKQNWLGCPPKAHMFRHLVSSRWCCWGRLYS